MSSSSRQELSFSLELLRLSEVKPHEEVKQKNLTDLSRAIRQSGVQLDPVIVDARTNVALDGMHRIKAIQSLELKRIMVAKVDYSDERVKLMRWLRATKEVPSHVLDELKYRLDLRKVESYNEAIELVDSGKSAVALIGSAVSYASAEGFSDNRRLFSIIRLFDSYQLNIKHIVDDEITDAIKDGFVLYIKKPTKEDVVIAGLTGELFPSKSTRHIVPGRPVNIRCPLELLSSKYSEDDAKAKFESYVSSLKSVVLPPGSFYSDRVYPEEILLYNPETIP